MREIIWDDFEILNAKVEGLVESYLNAPDKAAWAEEWGFDDYWTGDGYPDELDWYDLSAFANERLLDWDWEWECFIGQLQDELDKYDTYHWHVETPRGERLVRAEKADEFIWSLTPRFGEWRAYIRSNGSDIRITITDHDGSALYIVRGLETHLDHVARNLAQAKNIPLEAAQAWVDYYTYDSTITLEQALTHFDRDEALEMGA